MHEDCYQEGHCWRGTGVCLRCGERLRCICGVFVREDKMDAHLQTCRCVEAEAQAERDSLNSYLLGEAMV